MARTIVTCNNDFVNYDNIVSITILKTDDEEDAEEKSVVTDDDYGLVAVDIMNNVHILGMKDTSEKRTNCTLPADSAKMRKSIRYSR